MADLPELIVADVGKWHEWLERHHHRESGVRLVLAKKGTTHPTSLTYDEALEEALCHGWIDGQAGRRDETTYRQRFTPRRKRSPWSKRNVGIVARLEEQDRMHSAGVAEVDRAKADGRWEAAYAGSASIEIPDDLKRALAKKAIAQAMFDILTSQNRYAILYRVENAKRSDTRTRRIDRFVEMLAREETIYPQKRKLPASKKTASKKTASKKTASKKTASKKTASKKTASKKTASKKTARRRPSSS